MGTQRSVRRWVDLDVPAHVAFERMCRVEEYPRFRTGVRRVSAVSETRHRWDLVVGGFTAHLDERRPDAVLRWHAVTGPPCAETVTVRALSPRRSRLSVACSGAPVLVTQVAADLDEFKRTVERDHPPVGHHINERPFRPGRHRSNWRDDLLRGRTGTGYPHAS